MSGPTQQPASPSLPNLLHLSAGWYQAKGQAPQRPLVQGTLTQGLISQAQPTAKAYTSLIRSRP